MFIGGTRVLRRLLLDGLHNRIIAAFNRQRAIIEVLDITKNQAAVQVDEGAEAETVVMSEKVEVQVRPIRL